MIAKHSVEFKFPVRVDAGMIPQCTYQHFLFSIRCEKLTTKNIDSLYSQVTALGL